MASESVEVARLGGDTRKTSKQSNRSKTVKSNTVITVENANECLQWIPEYKVIVCREHEYAIGSVAQHLRIFHSGKDVEKRKVATEFASCDLQTPKDVTLPPPLGEPFPELGKPILAFICEEPECERISISRDEMRKHCNRAHAWKSSKEHREHWHRVWVQSFFKSAGLQKYFTVDYTDQEQEESSRNRCSRGLVLSALDCRGSSTGGLDDFLVRTSSAPACASSTGLGAF